MVSLSMSKTADKLYAKKRYFIFDLDGTLINLMPFDNWDKIKQRLSEVALSEFGEKVSFSSLLKGCDYVENKYGEDKRLLLCKYLEDEENAAAKTLATLHNPGITLLRRLKDFVTHANQDEAPLFIILSNNFTSTIEIALSRYNLRDMFDYIVGRDLAGKMKPDPAGLDHIMGYIIDNLYETESEAHMKNKQGKDSNILSSKTNGDLSDKEVGKPGITRTGKIEQSKSERVKIEQSKSERVKIEQSKSERVKIEQSKSEQVRIEQSISEQVKNEIKEKMILFGDSEFDERAARNFGIDFIYID